MLLGGLGVLDRSPLGEFPRCKNERARRRWGGSGGGTLMDGDARTDARDEATMASERASSPMPMGSSIRLRLLVEFDWLDKDNVLGVEARKSVVMLDPRGGGTRGGSLGFGSSDGTE